jgi:hypothetical protein
LLERLQSERMVASFRAGRVEMSKGVEAMSITNPDSNRAIRHFLTELANFLTISSAVASPAVYPFRLPHPKAGGSSFGCNTIGCSSLVSCSSERPIAVGC